MKNRPQLPPGVKEHELWPADYVLHFRGGIVLLGKRKKRGDSWSICVFKTGGSSTHTGASNLREAIKVGRKECAAFERNSMTRQLTINALRQIIDRL